MKEVDLPSAFFQWDITYYKKKGINIDSGSKINGLKKKRKKKAVPGGETPPPDYSSMNI